MGLTNDCILSQEESSLLFETPYFSHSISETIRLGNMLAQKLQPQDVVAFIGDLGAGKTHFIKGVAQGFGIDDNLVNSPTFVYVNHYETTELTLFHFDLYRLTKAQDFYAMGFDEYFSQNGICLIEWPNIIITSLPSKNTYFVHIEHVDETTRKILITQKAL